MERSTSYAWILDSGGVGRGAWQGGVIYEFMQWSRKKGSFPSITMGASAGGYAAADVATGTEKTVMKGWTCWGQQRLSQSLPSSEKGRRWSNMRNFRTHLHDSILYVMDKSEMSGIFEDHPGKKLLVFTTRVRRRDRKPFKAVDQLRFFLRSATRKLPKPLKYIPDQYLEDPVVFATNLPADLCSEHIRPLKRRNFHAVIEASCLVPVAMGSPLLPGKLSTETYHGDGNAVFVDGGYALKMPMGIFEEDLRFRDIARWASADKTVVFCCDPSGHLWETSTRLRRLNTHPSVIQARQENRMLVVSPDHRIEAGFLCTNNAIVMRTFERGREQARQLLQTEQIRRFFDQTL